jgi:hypothetical protein
MFNQIPGPTLKSAAVTALWRTIGTTVADNHSFTIAETGIGTAIFLIQFTAVMGQVMATQSTAIPASGIAQMAQNA